MKMGDPYDDDECMNCGSYNNPWVICDECFIKILRNEGITEDRIKEIVKGVTG